MSSFYDIHAKSQEHLDSDESFLNSIDSPKLDREIENVKNKKVLEVGAGTGRIAKKILKSKPSVFICTEPSEEARKVLDNLGIQNLSSLNEIAESFDYIFVVQTLIHIQNKKEFIQQLSKLLNKKGKIVLSILAQKDPSYIEINGQKIFQEIYPNNIEVIKTDISSIGLNIIEQDTVIVDESRIELFGAENKGKTLSWYLVVQN